MTPIKIRYVKWLSILLLVVGVLSLGLGVFVTGEVVNMISGGVLTLIGILFLVNPMLHIEADQVRVMNAIGMTMRRFPLSSPADLRLDGKKLMHVPTDKKILNLGFGADPDDVAALRALLGANPPS